MVVLGWAWAASSAFAQDVMRFSTCAGYTWDTSRVCGCLNAAPDGPAWFGGLGIGFTYTHTCFDVDWVMGMSPAVHQDLKDELERMGMQVAAARHFVVAEESLVSQKDTEQFTDWLLITGTLGKWLVLDPEGSLVTELAFPDNVPTVAAWLDLNGDQVDDLVLGIDEAELWVAYGPVVSQVLYPPKLEK